MNKILVLGDQHGRDFWRSLLDMDLNTIRKIIFLGDYSDPYSKEGYTHNKAILQLEDIIKFKKDNMDKVVLLLGNHDFHYLYPEYACSRFSKEHFPIYNEIYNDEKSLFKMAHIENNVLFTHAGILSGWLRFNKLSEENIDNILNEKVKLDQYNQVSFYRGGYHKYGSPIWADMRDYLEDAPLSITQVFGHTMLTQPIKIDNRYCIDCQKIFDLDKLLTSKDIKDIKQN